LIKLTVYKARAKTIPATTANPPRAMVEAELAGTVVLCGAAVPEADPEAVAEVEAEAGTVGLRDVERVMFPVG